jgi:hypothetical protein
MGSHTTLLHYFYLINLKILNKAKIENFIFKQIKVTINSSYIGILKFFLVEN